MYFFESLNLLDTKITSSCFSTLLFRSGIELNPGPDCNNDKEAILAYLAVKAEDEDVKQTLRLYDPNLTLKELRRKLSAHDKEKLIKTMTFMGISDQELYTKPTVVHNLICRIQNLFLVFCPLCQCSNTVNVDDIPILECALCKQSAHTQCVLNLL